MLFEPLRRSSTCVIVAIDPKLRGVYISDRSSDPSMFNAGLLKSTVTTLEGFSDSESDSADHTVPAPESEAFNRCQGDYPNNSFRQNSIVFRFSYS